MLAMGLCVMSYRLLLPLLQAFSSSTAEQSQQLAEGLRQGLDAKCHDTHLRLEERVGETAGWSRERECVRACAVFVHTACVGTVHMFERQGCSSGQINASSTHQAICTKVAPHPLSPCRPAV